MTPFSMRRERKDDYNELPFTDDLQNIYTHFESYMHR